MALGDIYLGAVGSEVLLTPFGRTLTIKDNELSREARTANGRLVKDIITVKKQFTLEYSDIDGDKLDDLITISELQDELSLIVYSTETLHDHYTVLMKPLDRKRLLLLSPGIWSNVSVVLDEV